MILQRINVEVVIVCDGEFCNKECKYLNLRMFSYCDLFQKSLYFEGGYERCQNCIDATNKEGKNNGRTRNN